MVDEPKDYRLTVRITDSQALALDSRALLSGVTRSDFVREMIEKGWGSRLAKSHRPYVGITGLLLEISSKLDRIKSRHTLSSVDTQNLESVVNKLDSVLNDLTVRMARDQEELLNADNEKETFE